VTVKISNIGQIASVNSISGEVERKSEVDILVEGDIISEVGSELGNPEIVIDSRNGLVTPGFVDPHTHPVFAGTREKEFEMRSVGKSYEEIAQAGGGIISSVESLHKTSEEELTGLVKKRMWNFLKLGTTTVEAKSGYGLSTESELKSLKVLQNTERDVPIDIVPTFLGAHDFPPEFKDNRRGYVSLICEEMLPAVAEQGIAKYCDIFCENGWFDVNDSNEILNKAVELGLSIRLHADEFQDSGAAVLAVELGAVSADHLMYIPDKAIKQFSENNVIATLLPGTTFFLGKNKYAPARKMIDQGVIVALATDFNPGSSMIQSMPFIMSLACIYMKMTVEEVFKSATFNAAKSIEMDHLVGTIEQGKQADILIWDVDDLSQLMYSIGDICPNTVIKKGKVLEFQLPN
tara:strand:- start:15749 stop:16963 length:1215 start_codon:yes stop_codon:yes gene_type:complete